MSSFIQSVLGRLNAKEITLREANKELMNEVISNIRDIPYLDSLLEESVKGNPPADFLYALLSSTFTRRGKLKHWDIALLEGRKTRPYIFRHLQPLSPEEKGLLQMTRITEPVDFSYFDDFKSYFLNSWENGKSITYAIGVNQNNNFNRSSADFISEDFNEDLFVRAKEYFADELDIGDNAKRVIFHMGLNYSKEGFILTVTYYVEKLKVE